MEPGGVLSLPFSAGLCASPAAAPRTQFLPCKTGKEKRKKKKVVLTLLRVVRMKPTCKVSGEGCPLLSTGKNELLPTSAPWQEAPSAPPHPQNHKWKLCYPVMMVCDPFALPPRCDTPGSCGALRWGSSPKRITCSCPEELMACVDGQDGSVMTDDFSAWRCMRYLIRRGVRGVLCICFFHFF